MNIDKIVKECPRAWEEWIKSLDLKLKIDMVFANRNNLVLIVDEETSFYYHFRVLYDHFDSVGIRVELTHIGDTFGWIYDICKSDQIASYYEGSYDTRTEAEYRAFEKAFEIREEQLNKEVVMLKRIKQKYKRWLLNRELKLFEEYLDGATGHFKVMINLHIKSIRGKLNEMD